VQDQRTFALFGNTIVIGILLVAAIVLELPPVVVLAGSFLLAASLLGSIALAVVLERKARLKRVIAAVTKRSSRKEEGGQAVWQKGAMSLMRLSTQRFAILKDRQLEETRRQLVSAGYRSRDAVVVFTFFKLVSPLIFLAGSGLYVLALDPIGKGTLGNVAAIMGAALFGSKLPDLILKNKRSKRLESIRKSLPDALDMVVICAEAGLASDAALKRVVAETSRRSSVLGDELNQLTLELSFMPDRRQALDNLADRAPIPSIQAFTNTLIQAEKYGTPLARAFKVLSQEQRQERMMRAEEKAGRLPATMTVPMMLFILPALFIVLIGPAILDIMDNFINMD
jgi:tight adherence protein C